jgi:hypothetical protein
MLFVKIKWLIKCLEINRTRVEIIKIMIRTIY